VEERRTVFWIQLIVVSAVVFVVAAVVLGAGGTLTEPVTDQPDLELPAGPLTAGDVDAVRFPLAFRGYRMNEVDDVLDRLRTEIVVRDARIMELEYRLGGGQPTSTEPDVEPATEQPVDLVKKLVKPDLTDR
jgi:DivIVA domain-containing protein